MSTEIPFNIFHLHVSLTLARRKTRTMDSIRIARVDNVTLETFAPPNDAGGVPNKERRKGTLHLTPHHLIFTSTSGFDPTSGEAETWIPYPSITLLTRLPQTFGGVYPLQIRTRTFHSYVLGFDKAMEGGAEDVWLSVKDCAVAGMQYLLEASLS
jgi:hypothetical protein